MYGGEGEKKSKMTQAKSPYLMTEQTETSKLQKFCLN